MPLSEGARFGSYEIVSSIGAGGMGEVYLARDTKLNRDVAIKVLPELFAADRDRLMRFEREAQVLASLNHPNIAHVHGLIDDPLALVMEFVEGEDLAQRLKRGALPLGDAVVIGKQIAAALEAAHEQGIVHRDLKPANVKVRDDGTAKVLDFGLAKATDRAGSSGDNVMNSPTLTARGTELGLILGTAAYMAPEQAKGKSVDKRADIWAFGAVLYEMLTGRSPFPGDSTTEVLGAVVLQDPDWTFLPAGTPFRIRELLRRCLEKDPKHRLRDIGDAAYELSAGGSTSPPVVRTPSGWLRTASLVASGAVLACIVTWLAMRAPDATPASPKRFAVTGLSPLMFDAWQSLTLSPDASALAFRGRGADGVDRIYVRDFHSLELRPLAGTEGGRMPFFSPDGQWIAFFAGSVLKKIAVGGGPAQTIAPASGPSGGTWMDDGSIVFVGDPVQGVQRVPATGGTPETLLQGPRDTLDAFATPWGLPGSQAVLLLQKNGATFDAAVLSLKNRQLRVLARDAYSPAWVPSGHLLFHQGDAILAMRFDPQTLTTRGDALPVAHGIGNRISYQSRLFTVADDGTLVYIPAAPPGEGGWSMVLVDRDGKETVAARLERQADTPRFSPDGTRVAFRTPAPNCDIWVRDLARGTTTRLTREGDNHGVVWRPDGTRVLSARNSSTGTEILALPADGAGAPEIVANIRGAAAMMPTSWSPGGALLVQDRYRQETGTDILAIPANGGERQPLLDGPSDEAGGVISAGGKLLAYVSDESGRNEIYVQPYGGQGPRTLVSVNGGIEPVWSPAGDELFFRNGRDVFSVLMKPVAGRAAMQPQVLFSGDYPVGPQVANYDVSPDGRQLLMTKGRQWPEGQIVVVLNWLQELEKSHR